MTLEDFFTLTEMKDGLTSLSRVEELVKVMQKEKDCAVKNVGDASRQWTAVASTIAATENKDCLDLFIQLDGLWFIDRWLQDAQKFCTNTSESFIEESITALLQALEKLHINSERSMSSGIWITVKNLLGHKSSTVQDRARILFDSWKQERNEDVSNREADNIVVSHDDGSSKLVAEDSRPSASSIPTDSEGTNKGNTYTSDPAERGDDVGIHTDNNQPSTDKILDCADAKERSADPTASSVVSNPVKENPSTMEDPTVRPPGGTSVETSFPVPKKGTVEEPSDFQKVNEVSKNEKHSDKVESSVSSPVKPGSASLVADAASPRETKKQPDLEVNVEANENDWCQKISGTDCAIAPASESKSAVGESRVVNHSNAAEDGECCSNALHDSSVTGNMLGKPEDLEMTSSLDDLGTVYEDKEHASDEDGDFRIAYEFSKPVMDTKSSDVINKRRSDSELDYGVDALEVARQVAKAVEREVFKGPFPSSSSEKTSEGGLKQPGSPDSINEKQDLPTEGSPHELPTAQSHSAEARSEGEVHVRNEANLDAKPDNHDMEFSQVTEAAQETEINPGKGLCGFDLNEEVCSDEMDQPGNAVSTPISVVSASRPATIPGLPVAPLQFEGTLGWKGSAATSAFRPASPRKNPDSDKNHSVGGTSDSSSKQRHDFLNIDLNVAEGGDDLGKQIPASSGLPSGESSIEVSQRSERFKLDLNRIEDDGDVLPSNTTVEGQHMYNRNGRCSPTPASSSSSMQPSMRNFDLNDGPSLQDSLDQGPSKFSQILVSKPDASVISIMGTRVEINRKDSVPQVTSLPNGKAVEPAVDATVTSSFLGLAPTGSYTHSPVFGYNGLTTGPSISLSSAMYGPTGAIPCVVDTRTTLLPQIVPSATAVPPYSQPPFMLSMTNAQPGLNGAGPSRPNFDLNSGYMVEGGNRDSGLRQFFITGQEHLRTNSQPPSSSSIGGKRKEPDGGWEAYQFSYNPQQPPWR